MEVQVDNAGGLRRNLRVTVPAERVAQAVDDKLKRLATRAKLPGFRPGKAPMKVIESQYGESARLDAISELIEQTYPEAVGKTGVQPAGQPKIDIAGNKVGEALQYTAQIEVYPEVKLGSLADLKIERPVVEISEADVDKLVTNLRKAKRTFNDATRAAQTGDQVVVDFIGRLDGEAFAGGEGKDATIELGEGRMLPDLENGIAGHAVGETFTVDVKFPDDYRAENLKGRTAQFEVTLKSVKEPQLPAIDEEFLKSHGVEDGAGEAGLRVKCRAALEKERAKGVQNRLKSQALEQLLEKHPLEIPRTLIDQEIPRLRDEAAARMGLNRQGVKFSAEKLEGLFPAEMFVPQAQRRVALGLLIGEVIKAKDVKLDQARVDQALEGIAGDYEHPDQVRQFYRSRPDLMQGLRAMVLEDQVVETLLQGANATEKKMSLDELLGAA
jgi:trigger factor